MAQSKAGCYERLAVVEQKVDSVEQHIKDDKHAHEAIEEKLDRIERELSRYRGFIGGILFVVTAVVTFLRLYLKDLINFFK